MASYNYVPSSFEQKLAFKTSKQPTSNSFALTRWPKCMMGQARLLNALWSICRSTRQKNRMNGSAPLLDGGFCLAFGTEARLIRNDIE